MAQRDAKSADTAQTTEATAPAETTETTAAQTPDAAPEKVAQKRYSGPAVGATADADLYGVIQPDGSVKVTGSGGKTAPKAGERGVLIVAKGDTVTRGIVEQLGG